jgi:hypothetical protein
VAFSETRFYRSFFLWLAWGAAIFVLLSWGVFDLPKFRGPPLALAPWLTPGVATGGAIFGGIAAVLNRRVPMRLILAAAAVAANVLYCVFLATSGEPID